MKQLDGRLTMAAMLNRRNNPKLLTSLTILCVLISCLTFYFFIESKNNAKQAQEFKNKFETASALQKEGFTRIEMLMAESFEKSITLERRTQALETSNDKLRSFTLEKIKLEEELAILKAAAVFQEEQYAKLIGQKKSSETRLGQISEQLAPFLADYPFEPKRAKVSRKTKRQVTTN